MFDFSRKGNKIDVTSVHISLRASKLSFSVKLIIGQSRKCINWAFSSFDFFWFFRKNIDIYVRIIAMKTKKNIFILAIELLISKISKATKIGNWSRQLQNNDKWTFLTSSYIYFLVLYQIKNDVSYPLYPSCCFSLSDWNF